GRAHAWPRAACVLRILRPESVLIDCETRGFGGFCAPCCLSRSGEDLADQQVERRETCFAAPEVLGEIQAAVGPPADVYLVATLATGLLSGGRPNDTVSMGP